MRVGLWHGDVGEPARRRMLRDPPEILLTTPESVEAVMISARIEHEKFLQGVRVVIVDELHAFAGDDRGWHLMFLLARLERLTGRCLQRIGLSATVGNPAELLNWFALGRGGRVIGTRDPASSGDVTADHVGSVHNAITVITRLYRGERRLVFANTRTRVEKVAAGLRAAGVRTFVSHASLSFDERRRAEAAFAEEPDCVIVSTSTLELGIDVDDLDRGGRSWKVADVDWRRRAVSVVHSDRGGRSRSLGSGRVLPRAVCTMMEHIVAGAEPACRLSHRAETAIAQIWDRLAFVDADSLPIVSDDGDRVVIWAFLPAVQRMHRSQLVRPFRASLSSVSTISPSP
jgi:Helicase conserved C-terminal domain/DEAD/DEAH box helicase